MNTLTRADTRMHAGADSTLLLTVSEAAEQLRISKSLVYRLIATGAIAAITVGTRRLVPYASLQRFVADRLSATGATSRASRAY